MNVHGQIPVQTPKMNPRSEELAKAVRDGNKERALELIKDGANPFDHGYSDSEQGSAFSIMTYSPNGFDEASEKKDINLILHMCAKPGSSWENRFLVCRHETRLAPISGRKLANLAHPTPTSVVLGGEAEFAMLRFRGATKEAVETLLMYGYKFSAADYEEILLQSSFDSRDHMQEWKSLFALALAAELPNIPESILNRLMSQAIGDSSFRPSRGGRDPLTSEIVTTYLPFSNFDLAAAMLKSGADPNALWTKRHGTNTEPPQTHLMKALRNRDKPMVELLVKYGADAKAEAVQEMAAEVGMEHLLELDPVDVVVADPVAYGKQLRKQFMHSFYCEVKTRSAILTVAMMRKTGCTPQKHLMSNLILKYCPLGFNLWEVGTVVVKSKETTTS